mmetsp:Transcript_12184/g.16834  ORF Transcript_12184/g.16834 Transcript_12184/m.16834 type:complete len:101 (+) Transcript_12184:212-514(+)|eukprot:CAMPEP_0168544692 /NCGR_PEP_ID=MMETSP0413-20121227/2559_1 /TAXON_ID=136452 /ORGANISM="Filamoeba nolandi, Strain NC-AS-23-1" /LENGTH=100 /DNA_ID=CAMNT_0008574737 /DNA_START=146 /DNA_END=448 /DNA_ORIENTATION=-
MSSTNEIQVKHDATKKEFYIDFENGERALINYDVINNKTLDMYHTFAPESQRGKGIAGKLAKAAMDYVAENDMKAVLTCSYLRNAWLAQNPQYKQYVTSQ